MHMAVLDSKRLGLIQLHDFLLIKSGTIAAAGLLHDESPKGHKFALEFDVHLRKSLTGRRQNRG